jgi:hypothetical protein
MQLPCDHDWNAVSHEESICRKCGFTQFMQDI